MTDLYRVGKKEKSRWRRRLAWLVVLLIVIGLIIVAVIIIREKLKPQVVIKQARATKTHVAYSSKTKHYDEGNFSIDILTNWQPLTRPPGPYKTYSWQTSDSGTDGQVLTIYEDTIPANFAVNRVLIVRGETDHVAQDGTVSDNCSKYTNGASAQYQAGAAAKWQDVSFLCDQSNKQRDIIGTSSLEGVNTVTLRGSTAGSHKYFFTYSNYNAANPDYAPFYNALTSLRIN